MKQPPKFAPGELSQAQPPKPPATAQRPADFVATTAPSSFAAAVGDEAAVASPTRAALIESGQTRHRVAAASLWSQPPPDDALEGGDGEADPQRENRRPSLRENDAAGAVGTGLARERRSEFEAAAASAAARKLLGARPHRGNDAAATVGSGAAKGRLFKFEEAAAAMRAAKKLSDSSVSRRKPFKHSISRPGAAPVTGINAGSRGESGMARGAASNDNFRGAAGNVAKSTATVSLFASASAEAPGMAKAKVVSDNLRGTGLKSAYLGATQLTSGSLNAPGMAKDKLVPPDIAGAAATAALHAQALKAGKAYAVHQGGTLLTNGSIHAPGMNHQKKAGQAGAGGVGGASGGPAVGGSEGEPPSGNSLGMRSVDTGISLFAMGACFVVLSLPPLPPTAPHCPRTRNGNAKGC